MFSGGNGEIACRLTPCRLRSPFRCGFEHAGGPDRSRYGYVLNHRFPPDGAGSFARE
jgi:hypothetical protein